MMNGAYSNTKLHDEEMTSTSSAGLFKQGDDLQTEIFELKSSFHATRFRLTTMVGGVLLLALLGVAGSFAALKQSKSVKVDPNTYRLVTKDGHHSVGAVGM